LRFSGAIVILGAPALRSTQTRHREANVPELRIGLDKLKLDAAFPFLAPEQTHHSAADLLPGLTICQDQFLIHLHAGAKANDCTLGQDRLGEAMFFERLLAGEGAANHDRDVDT
jgi:hypothetical protein